MAALEKWNIDRRESRSLAADRNRWRSLRLTSTPARQKRTTKKKKKKKKKKIRQEQRVSV